MSIDKASTNEEPKMMTVEEFLALPDDGVDRELIRGELKEYGSDIDELFPCAEPKMMTVEEFLALPDDGVDRELIRGVVKEYGMTMRNRSHARVETRIAQVLANWLDGRPEPQGEIVSGEAGFRLKGTKESSVGIDVAYVSAEQRAATGPDQTFFNGPPVLAVEVLSPSDKNERFLDKLDLYFESGVAVVWEVDPRLRTVRVHRPGREPEMVSASQELVGDPELPGFRVATARIFTS